MYSIPMIYHSIDAILDFTIWKPDILVRLSNSLDFWDAILDLPSSSLVFPDGINVVLPFRIHKIVISENYDVGESPWNYLVWTKS